MDLIIRDGLLVTGSDLFKADIGIQNGKISIISENLLESARNEINAEGKYVFPGFIDVHTHLDMPLSNKVSSVDNFYTGTVAAAYGGTTCIVDYICPATNQTLEEGFNTWFRKAEHKSIIDYGFHMTITNPTDKILDEVQNLPNYGITSLKCFTAYKDRFMMTDDQLFRMLKESKETGILICMHCENGYLLDYLTKNLIKEKKTTPQYHPESRPPFVEEEAVQRAIDLATIADAPIFIAHLSTAGGLEKVKEARNASIPVYAETCPAYLMFNDEVYKKDPEYAAKYICSPPLRPSPHPEELWKGIFSSYIQVIGTDHCPFNINKEKQLGLKDFTKMPNGLPGIEDRIPVMFSEGVIKRNLDINKFVSITSTMPAKLFGLYPTKGNLNVSADADLVIYDPEKQWMIDSKKHHMNVDYNIFEGLKITGKPKYVLSRGEIIIQDDELKATKGRGKYIKRNPSQLFG